MPVIENHKGFTLIELMIVIAIAAVLAGIGVWSAVSVAPAYRLKGAVSLVQGDLYTAKVRAAKNNRQYKVVFTTNGYQVQRGTSGSGSFTLDAVEISRTFANDYQGVTVNTSATNDPVLSPRGTSTAVTITLQNTSGATKAITISIAGRIKVN